MGTMNLPGDGVNLRHDLKDLKMMINSGSRLRVVVRVRPPLDAERRDDICSLLSTDTHSHSVSVRHTHRVRGTQTDKRFSFDGLLDRTATQGDTFAALGVKSLIRSVFEGFNATVFAYGQTGSGKTYTMEGYDYENSTSVQADPKARARPVPRIRTSSQDKIGIIPRALAALFDELELERSNCESAKKGEKLAVRCSFVQIYNERVLDLLNPASNGLKSGRGGGGSGNGGGGGSGGSGGGGGSGGRGPAGNPGLKLRWSQQRGFYAENLYVVEVESQADAVRVFHTGLQGKIMAGHSMNAASSRSHCIFSVIVHRTSRAEDVVAGAQGEKVTSSTISFVDLAGSEKASQTGATGVTLNESIGINTSLHALRKVIKALADSAERGGDGNQHVHVPYRDSKLTSLLQHAIGGNSITVMVACLSPCDRSVEENLSTLQYASRAQSIENRPVVNVDPTTRLIRRLRLEIRSLKKQLVQARRLADVASSVSGHRQEGTANGGGGGSGDVEVRVRRLKQELIDNIDMIKTMYASETQLRAELDTVARRADKLQAVNGDLHTENARLRNQLSSLIGDGSRRGRAQEAANIVETVTIPGYGVARARALDGESGSRDDRRDDHDVLLGGDDGGASKDPPVIASGGFFDLVSEDPPVQARQHQNPSLFTTAERRRLQQDALFTHTAHAASNDDGDVGGVSAAASAAAADAASAVEGSNSNEQYAMSPTLIRSLGSGGSHAMLSRPPPTLQPQRAAAVPPPCFQNQKMDSRAFLSRAGRDFVKPRAAKLSSGPGSAVQAYGNGNSRNMRSTGISGSMASNALRDFRMPTTLSGATTKAKRGQRGTSKRGAGAAARSSAGAAGAAPGHLSVGALRSLLGGSSKGSSNSSVLAEIPGTPGVLARAQHYSRTRTKLGDEPG